MSTIGGPEIITDGLVFLMDAANKKSYPGSGTSSTELINGTVGELINNTTFSPTNYGTFVFDGIDDYIETNSNALNLGTSPFTISVWLYPIGMTTNTPSILSNQTPYTPPNNFNGVNFALSNLYVRLIVDWNTNTTATYGYIQTTSKIPTNQWTYLTAVMTGSDRTAWKIYFNTTSMPFSETGSDLTGTGINSAYTLQIGKRPYTDAVDFTGNISTVKIYNRVLTQEEVTQNYNVTKGRFGL